MKCGPQTERGPRSRHPHDLPPWGAQELCLVNASSDPLGLPTSHAGPIGRGLRPETCLQFTH
eukprot:2061272-Pyramimonas_sp.AAC.1